MPFADDNQKIVELSTIIEIGIPKAKHARFKTKRGAEKHVEKLAFQFMQRIKRLGDVETPVYLGSYNYGDTCIINDFGYSCYNKCRVSKRDVVYRLFGSTLHTILSIDDDPTLLMRDYWYTFEGYRVRLSVCGAVRSEDCNIHYSGDDAPVFVKSEVIK